MGVLIHNVSKAPGLSPQSLIVAGFAALILVGTLVLWLPLSQVHGDISLIDSLFTSTSAVCVTGLVVRETGADFSLLGQVVILVLVQAGGLGAMAFAALAFDLLGRRLSLRAQSAFNESFFQMDAATGFHRRLLRIVQTVAAFEGVGAILLFGGFMGHHSIAEAAYSAIFHSVSAFCNAGFSLYADSLVGFRHNLLVMVPISVLIVAGGIGQPVLLECRRLLRSRTGRPLRPGGLSLHTRVVLWSSLLLIGGGTFMLALAGMPAGNESLGSRLSGALFQSISARTAGFNSVAVDGLPIASLLSLCVLMFIGGSPGSCAGGIKTTTAVLWLAQLTSRLQGRKWPSALGRHIPGELARRASTLVGVALLWNILGVILLALTEAGNEAAQLRDIMFEQLSAFGTVGLSTGLTAHLSALGKCWIILTMFVGRIGPLTLVVWAFEQRHPGVRLPEGKVMIG